MLKGIMFTAWSVFLVCLGMNAGWKTYPVYRAFQEFQEVQESGVFSYAMRKLQGDSDE